MCKKGMCSFVTLVTYGEVSGLLLRISSMEVLFSRKKKDFDRKKRRCCCNQIRKKGEVVFRFRSQKIERTKRKHENSFTRKMSSELQHRPQASSRWNRACRHVFGTVYGTDDHLTAFVSLVNSLLNSKDLVRAVVGDETCPSTGRRHLQVAFTHGRPDGKACKRSFNWWQAKLTGVGLYLPLSMDDTNPDPGEGVFSVWLRPQAGTNEQARAYCIKEGCVLVDRDIQVTHQGERRDFSAFVDAVRNGDVTSITDVIDSYPAMVARYRSFVDLVFSTYQRTDYTLGAPLPPSLRLWQADVIEICLRDASLVSDSRTVNICIGKLGNEGKSFLCRFLERILREHFGMTDAKVQIIRPGKLENMAYNLKDDNWVIVFDVPRSRTSTFQWSFVEEVKDRFVMSTKYVPKEIVLKRNPHVFVFCNEFVNEDDNGRPFFSEDRLRYVDITKRSVDEVRSFDAIKDRVNYEDPDVNQFGQEYSSDATGDGPVMNSAAYKMMHKEGDGEDFYMTCKKYRGFSVVHRYGVFMPPEMRVLYPPKGYYRTKLVGWPVPESLTRGAEVWCMKLGRYVSMTQVEEFYYCPAHDSNAWELYRWGVDEPEIVGPPVKKAKLPKSARVRWIFNHYEDIEYSLVHGFHPDHDPMKKQK